MTMASPSEAAASVRGRLDRDVRAEDWRRLPNVQRLAGGDRPGVVDEPMRRTRPRAASVEASAVASGPAPTMATIIGPGILVGHVTRTTTRRARSRLSPAAPAESAGPRRPGSSAPAHGWRLRAGRRLTWTGPWPASRARGRLGGSGGRVAGSRRRPARRGGRFGLWRARHRRQQRRHREAGRGREAGHRRLAGDAQRQSDRPVHALPGGDSAPETARRRIDCQRQQPGRPEPVRRRRLLRGHQGRPGRVLARA